MSNIFSEPRFPAAAYSGVPIKGTSLINDWSVSIIRLIISFDLASFSGLFKARIIISFNLATCPLKVFCSLISMFISLSNSSSKSTCVSNSLNAYFCSWDFISSGTSSSISNSSKFPLSNASACLSIISKKFLNSSCDSIVNSLLAVSPLLRSSPLAAS